MQSSTRWGVFLALIAVMFGTASGAAELNGSWQTEDKAVVVAIGACDTSGKTTCAVITGLLQAELKPYAKELCGLPLLWDLQPGPGVQEWSGGKILDPESERVFKAQLKLDQNRLWITAYRKSPSDGARFAWTRAKPFHGGC